LTAWLATNDPTMTAQARTQPRRRAESAIAPPSAIACQPSPCSPSFEKRAIARSARGVCPASRKKM
jgi:hypothetical protein